jgi:hypothetical protein
VARIITGREKLGFFLYALKEHTFMYGMSLLPLSFAGIGGAIWYFANDLEMDQTIFVAVSLVFGLGFFLMMIYFSISSMRYYYENAIIKKYGRYWSMPVAEITHEVDEEDEVVRCFISVRYVGQTLGDLFELPLEKKHLVPALEGMREVPVRVVEGMPSLLRIAPRKLLRELEQLQGDARA